MKKRKVTLLSVLTLIFSGVTAVIGFYWIAKSGAQFQVQETFLFNFVLTVQFVFNLLGFIERAKKKEEE